MRQCLIIRLLLLFIGSDVANYSRQLQVRQLEIIQLLLLLTGCDAPYKVR
ncbi:MAG: hypothetical protein KFF72_08255 [Arthrospira sp. SH-MAG29]|nr:hypothetical protein [Arthrospira sp. SH-MAG29]MBS0016338.1 hypothetical protein [Arthrospira sp. SH-MAG29]